MEIEAKVKMEHEDLVRLFSDATYGSDTLKVYYVIEDKDKFDKFREEHENDCLEDKWADWLLEGNSLEVNGNEEEDESEDYDEDLVGIIDIDIVNKQMSKASTDESVRRHFWDLVNEDDDFYTGYYLLQYIAYGELIFG